MILRSTSRTPQIMIYEVCTLLALLDETKAVVTQLDDLQAKMVVASSASPLPSKVPSCLSISCL